MSCFISFMNSLVFYFQKLILWSWIFKSFFFIIASSFLAGFCLGFLSPFQIRFLLWFFFLLVLLFPFLLKPLNAKTDFKLLSAESYKAQLFNFCSALAGFSSGLTGVGGGLILSPFFHESRLIPSKNIPAVLSVIFFFVTGFSLLGQTLQNSLNFTESSDVFRVCLQILPGYFLGSVAGYILNKRQKKARLRRQIIRFLVLGFFIKMTVEVFGLAFLKL